MSEAEAGVNELTPRALDSDAYNEFIAGLTLLSLETVEFQGKRIRSGASPTTTYQSETGYQIADRNLFLRFAVTAEPLGDDGDPVAIIDVAMVVAFEFSGDPPSREVIETFTERSASFMVTPNLREAIQSLALRLGYVGVVMPLLKQPASDAT